MTDTRCLLPLHLLVLCLIARISPAGEAAWQPTEAEHASIVALVDRCVALGYPDTRGAEFTRGTATVTAQVGGQRADPPLSTRLSTTQMSGDGVVTYVFSVRGVHARLADGSWLLGLRHALRPDATLTIAVDGPRVDPATLAAEAAAAKPFQAEKDAAKYLAAIPADQRARTAAVLDATVPMSFLLKLNPDDMPLAAVALTRAGCEQAPLLAWAIADQRARSYWQQRYWTDAAPPFDPTGAYAWSEQAEQDWRAALGSPVVEDPATALRRAWHRQFRAWLLTTEPGCPLDADAATAAATATLDPGDPQGHGARIAALRDALKIPAVPAKKSFLSDALRAWGPPPAGQPEFRVTASAGSMSTSFLQEAPAYAPAISDADRLIELVGDARPSRFHDFAGPRTIGDNALRALAQLMQKDPRAAISRDGDRPWTDREQSETAAALQTWWQEHRAGAMAQMVEGDVKP
ncbi:MAG: hypothetical protein H0V44_13675 [Planctomycetes bacterium]|nr:hypothetical protein [Planctomycetota bacterium]